MTYSKTLLSAGGIVLLAALSTHAATVTQTAHDATGTTSFNTGLNWSDATAPSAANDYVTSYNLRTPSAPAANFTFAGNSLTLLTNGQLGYKGTEGKTITVNNLHLNGGIMNGNGYSFTLAGSIWLDSSSSTFSNTASKNMTISASISGVAKLTLNIYQTPVTYTLTNTANSFTGGILVNSGAILDAVGDGVLGTGDVVVSSTSQLKLESGVTNNYIADTAKLTLSTTGTTTLNYTGIDYLKGVSLNGGTSFYTTPGETFGAIGSGATHESTLFTGTGLLEIVPEPGVNAMLLLGGAGLLFQVLRRKRCTA